MTSKTKVLFIGIDSADKDLILQWANAGLLPTFQNLLQKAAWGVTTNPVGFYVGALWPSFATGVSAARHGRYCYEQTKTGSYQQHRFNNFDLKGELFWDVLSRAGRRVAIIDVPLTPPSENINGIQITDWGVHKANKRDIFYTWPSSLVSDIEDEFGRNPIPVCNEIQRTPVGFKDFRDKMLERASKKAELSSKFLAQEEWDLFLTVFTEPHCIGHQCWHIHDSSHPKYDPSLVNALGDPVLDLYRGLDAAIGRVMANVGPETTVFVYSSHGMGPHYQPVAYLDEILRRLNGEEILNLNLLNHSSKFLKRLLRFVLKKVNVAIPENLATLEMADHKCSSVSNNNSSGAIRINLIGREPEGKVHPGIEYDRFCQQLSEDLKAIVNDDTGEPLVREVLRTSDYYQGEYVKDFPDLIVEWNRNHPISSVSSPKIGTIRHSFDHIRTGDHLEQGIFFITGPGINPGQIEQPTSVLDFAPTLAHLLKVPLPNVEGQVIPGISEITLEGSPK
jgi:predicted AlkP superfamily phosphohydrolase/phosphomutase